MNAINCVAFRGHRIDNIFFNEKKKKDTRLDLYDHIKVSLLQVSWFMGFYSAMNRTSKNTVN